MHTTGFSHLWFTLHLWVSSWVTSSPMSHSMHAIGFSHLWVTYESLYSLMGPFFTYESLYACYAAKVRARWKDCKDYHKACDRSIETLHRLQHKYFVWFLIELQFFNEFQILQLTLNFKFTEAQVVSPMYFKTFVMWAERQLCCFLGNLCSMGSACGGSPRQSRTRYTLC